MAESLQIKRKIVLDTETTGLDHESGHRIVEIGIVELENHLPTGNDFHYYLNPERDSDKRALEIHGLTRDFLNDKPKFSDCDRVKDKQIRPLPYFAIKFIASGDANSPKTHKSPSFSLFSSSTNIKILPLDASLITSSILDKPISTPRKISYFEHHIIVT